MKPSNEANELQIKIDTFRAENANIRRHLNRLRTTVGNLEKRIKAIKEDQQEESRLRREKDVVLHGIPINDTHEQPMEMIAILERAFNYSLLKPGGVYACSRLRSRDDNTPLLVKFESYDQKEKFMKHCEEKPVYANSFGGPRWKKVFVNEHLTKKNADLFRSAIRLRDAGIAKVWTNRGRVYMKRRALGARSVEIEAPDQIEKMKRVTGSFGMSDELADIRI